MPSLYIETSIVSYLRSRLSTHVVSAARQILTRRWWDEERKRYELTTSQIVIIESGRGNAQLAAERLAILSGLKLLDLTPQIVDAADRLLEQATLPWKARLDAIHICTAAYHRIDYLLTWNCNHIANARTLPRVQEIIEAAGLMMPVVCTPQEMVDDLR